VPLRPFGEPEGAPPVPTTQLSPGENRWTVSRDLVDYRSVLEIVKNGGVLRHDDTGVTTGRHVVERYSSVADDFASPRGDVEWSMTFARDGWSTRTVTRTVLTCTPTVFEVHGHLDAYEGEHRTFSRDWARSIPRDHL
jgi:hypothetical protein